MYRYQYLLFLSFLLLIGCQTNQRPQPISQKDTLFTNLPPSFTGVSFQNNVTEDARHNHLINDMFVAGAGVAIGDLNGDQLPDIYFAGNQVPDRLYLNKGDLKFEDISHGAGILEDGTWSTGVTMADVNNDGLLDIYVCKSVQENEQLSSNLLYINQGIAEGQTYPTFREMSGAYNLADRGFSVQATFFDYDKDGDLDVYIVNQPPSVGKRTGGGLYNRLNYKTAQFTDRLYKNTGEDYFIDVTQEAGLLNIGYGLSATVGDFNQDSWPDLYVTNDFDRPDHIYFNQQNGTFYNGINQAVKHISNFSMGSDVADYDNDGLLDIMVVDMVPEDHTRNKAYMGGMRPEFFWRIVNNGWHYQYMYNTLQKNNGNGTFCEVAQLAGVSSTDWSWGPLLADFDNDGWKDLFVTNGIKRNQRYTDLDKLITARLDSLEAIANKQGKPLDELIDVLSFVQMAPVDKIPNYIFKNNGDLTFSKKVQEWGLEESTLSYGGAYADLDLDGDLDLVLNNADAYATILRNNYQDQDPSNNYLKINIQNEHGGIAYGATARLYKDGEVWQLQELSNTRGYMSKSSDLLHFGTGHIRQVEQIKVNWPDGTEQTWTNVHTNQILTASPESGKVPSNQLAQAQPPFFDVSRQVGINHRHQENSYNDFKKEVLLPHKMSNFGPGLAVGDLNGDGLEDFYVGGAAGFKAGLYLQNKAGTFAPSNQSFLEADKPYEDLGALFFDADNDSDLDLYVVSGGNEFELDDPRLQDRLYLNDGKGNLSRALDHLPDMLNSGSRVKAADFDQDGDLDLFVGGRLLPGAYPLPARSYILQNEKGRFTDVTPDVAPSLLTAGLVTDAVWADFNQDNALDLVLVGEWMPITLLENQNGRFENKTEEGQLNQSTGWYFSIAAEDFDQDGDIDFVAGNLGLNYKYKASLEEPFEIYSKDFDQNNQRDIVLSYYEHGNSYPVRGRSCSSEQIPTIAEKFPTFEAFAQANLDAIYGEELLSALHYQAFNFASCTIQNQGDGTFSVNALPNEAQFSNINSLILKDFNQDGHTDLLVAGNLYGSEIETPRNDAGMGLFLLGDGKGTFTPVPLRKSGFFAPHDVKDMKLIQIGKTTKPVILIANNDNHVQAIAFDNSSSADDI